MGALRLTLATAAALWVLSAAASAETFCVRDDPSCAGTSATTLQDALTKAAGNGTGTRDTIKLPAGAFDDGPATDAVGNPVDIVGVGESGAVLTEINGTGNNHTVLSILEPSSTVSKLRVNVTGTGNETGIRLAGKLDHVSVWSFGVQASVTGIWVIGPNTTVADSKSLMVAYNASQAWVCGLAVGAGASVSLTDSIVAAQQGLDVDGGTADVQRTQIRANQGVDARNDAYVFLRNSTINTPGSGQSAKPDVGIEAHGAGTTMIDAMQVSMFDRLGTGTGVIVSPDAGAAAIAGLTDTVVDGYNVAAAVDAGGTLNTVFSAYPFGKVQGAGAHNHANDLDLTGLSPRFFTPAATYFQLRSDSPLIDAGDPNATTSGDFDKYNAPRLRDGNGDGIARVDIGASEYQREAPVVTATSDLATADPGQLVNFTATAIDADKADVVTFAWHFDDGGDVDGGSVQHAFATPGAHTATVTATDSAGRTSAASVQVTVPAPAPAPGGQPQPSATGTPLLTNVRLVPIRFRPLGTRPRGAARRVRAGSKLTFSLSQASTVKVVIERRQGRRWVAVGTVKAKRAAGRGSIAISGRLHRRPLAAGAYRLNAVARNAAGRTSAKARVRFTIVR